MSTKRTPFPNWSGVALALAFSGVFFLAALDDSGNWRPDKVWMAAGFSLLFVGVAVTAGIADWRSDRRAAKRDAEPVDADS